MSEASKSAQHTPGPWIALPRVWNGAASHAEGPGVFLVQDVATETVICERRTPWPEQAATMGANACLIAASPDLLSLALRMEPWLSGHEYQEKARGEREHDSQFLIDLRAAIAKATGASL